MNPKISVIIPCYNQVLFLEETLRSVVDQTYEKWECIIVDDGSTDGSSDIALKWCNLDERFLYFFKVNGGLSSARNTGLRLASGDYVQLLDADDLINPKKFEKQIEDLRNADISISDYFSFVDGNLHLAAKHRYLSPFVSELNFTKDIILDWEYRNSIPCHSVLFHKKLIDENNILFNETLPNHEDWVFWCQIFYVSKKIVNNYDVLALYRIRDISMTADYTLMRSGFIKACNVLLYYFKQNNEKKLFNVVCIKKNEIYNKNRLSSFHKIKVKIINKVNHIFAYVTSN